MAADQSAFWEKMELLVAECDIHLERPRGSTHPSYPLIRYPLDYGYLGGTRSGDGAGIDVWLGAGDQDKVTALICTFDGLKKDAELKLLLGCTQEESDRIEAFHNHGGQVGLMVYRK